MANVYVNTAGAVYSATSAGNAADSQITVPSAYLLSACTTAGVEIDTCFTSARAIANKHTVDPNWFIGAGTMRLLP